jgi:YbbR domain-containing protein
MKQRLTRLAANLFSLLLALVIAVAVWVNAVSTEDPNETRALTAPLAVEIIGLREDLVAQGYQSVEVLVTLRAPKSIWEQLIPENLHAQVDLAGKTEGTYSVPVRIQTDVSPVRVEKVEPASLQILIDRLGARSMPVHTELSGNLAPGFQAGPPALAPEQVELSGPESIVDRVVVIVAAVNIEGLRATTNQNVPLLPLDTEGNVVTGVSVEPATVSVSVPVQQLGGYRDLVVKVPLLGAVKSGYRLTGLTIDPQVVTLYSDDPDATSKLPGYVETQPLDINGATEDISTSLSLVLPQGVQVVGDSKILVQVSISAIEDSITLSRPVSLMGLAPGLTASFSPTVVDVVLSGPAPIIWSLSPADVDVFVNLDGKGPGTYQLAPEVIKPRELVLVILSPEKVEVVIVKAEPTPKP